jgi:hypothetical protein
MQGCPKYPSRGLRLVVLTVRASGWLVGAGVGQVADPGLASRGQGGSGDRAQVGQGPVQGCDDDGELGRGDGAGLDSAGGGVGLVVAVLAWWASRLTPPEIDARPVG